MLSYTLNGVALFLALFITQIQGSPTHSKFYGLPTYSEIASAEGHTNVAYYVNWAIYGRDYQPQQLPVSQLTHVLYAFANFYPNGSVYASDTYSDLEKHYPTDSLSEAGKNAYGCVKQLYLLKKHNRNLKVLLSIGGASYSANFAATASTSATRALFASTAVTLMKDWGFDGLDIDWEYPTNHTEATNFVLLLKAIRKAMDTYSKKYASSYHFLITAASPAGPAKYSIMHLAAMDAYLDAWFLMGFDYAGSWSMLAAHQANLFPSILNPNSTPFSTNKAVMDYLAAGVAPCKLSLGIPIYGRSFEATKGLGQPFTGIGKGTWDAGLWDYKALPHANSTVFYDKEAVASYSYDPVSQELISYDTVKSVAAKSAYVKVLGLGGAMFWETSADGAGNKSLITTSSNAFGALKQQQNLLNYPNSQYANIAAGMPGE